MFTRRISYRLPLLLPVPDLRVSGLVSVNAWHLSLSLDDASLNNDAVVAVFLVALAVNRLSGVETMGVVAAARVRVPDIGNIVCEFTKEGGFGNWKWRPMAIRRVASCVVVV